MNGGAGPSLSFEELFDPSFLAALEPFSLRIVEAQKGGRLADQRTVARGQGTDFACHGTSRDDNRKFTVVAKAVKKKQKKKR